jgi:hypothetical protein
MSFQSRPATRDGASTSLAPPPGALLVILPPRRVIRYFLQWTLYAVPLALIYAAMFHKVAWWLLAIPFLRVFNLLVLRARPWLALTHTELEGREKRVIWSVPRTGINSIQVGRGDPQRIEFADPLGRALASSPLGFTDRQISSLADALDVRVVDHRTG